MTYRYNDPDINNARALADRMRAAISFPHCEKPRAKRTMRPRGANYTVLAILPAMSGEIAVAYCATKGEADRAAAALMSETVRFGGHAHRPDAYVRKTGDCRGASMPVLDCRIR